MTAGRGRVNASRRRASEERKLVDHPRDLEHALHVSLTRRQHEANPVLVADFLCPKDRAETGGIEERQPRYVDQYRLRALRAHAPHQRLELDRRPAVEIAAQHERVALRAHNGLELERGFAGCCHPHERIGVGAPRVQRPQGLAFGLPLLTETVRGLAGFHYVDGDRGEHLIAASQRRFAGARQVRKPHAIRI
jgi:hypothetical protein